MIYHDADGCNDDDDDDDDKFIRSVIVIA